MNKINVGFIGSSFARKVQAPCFEMVEGCNLFGCASPNSSESFATEFNMPFSTKDWRELAKHPEVDLVCITTPPKLHYEQAMFCLENGKHILCEKPFTMNAKQARELADLAKEKKVLALIDHELRFNPYVLFVHDFIKNGQLGNMYFAHAISHISYRRNPAVGYDWWSDKAWGGGAWGAIASHLIDQLRFHTGSEITDLKAFLKASINKRYNNNAELKQVTSDDTAHAIAKLENGATASIFTSLVAVQNQLFFEITGDRASIRFDLDDNVFIASLNEPYMKVKVNLNESQKAINNKIETSRLHVKSIFARSFMHYAHAIIHTLQNGEIDLPGAATFEDGFKIQMALDMGYNN